MTKNSLTVLIGSIFFLLIGPLINSSEAANLDLNFRAEAGISKETRQWIDTLPEKIRIEMLQLLKDAQPIVDESVMKYLDRVDEIISTQTANARCEIHGLVEQILDSLGERFTGNNPRRIKELEENWNNLSFRKNQKIKSVVTDYADFALEAQKTLCYAAPAHEAALQAAVIRNQVSRRWAAWNRVKNMCDSFKTCFSHMDQLVINTIQESDPRDVESSGASFHKTFIKEPQSKWFPWTFTHKPYEEQILIMLHILDSIEIAKTARIQKTKIATDKISAATKELESINKDRNSSAVQINKNRSPRHKKLQVNALTKVLERVNRQDSIINSITPVEDEQKLQLLELSKQHASLKKLIQQNLNSAIEARDYVKPETGHPGAGDLK